MKHLVQMLYMLQKSYNIILTRLEPMAGSRIELAGFPHHSLDTLFT